MTIDWAKAEEHPDKSQKVEGRFLLDLRAKVNDLEKQLSENKSELSRTQTDLNSTKDALEKTVNELNGTKETLDNTNSELNETKTALENEKALSKEKDDTISNLTSEKENFVTSRRTYLHYTADIYRGIQLCLSGVIFVLHTPDFFI